MTKYELFYKEECAEMLYTFPFFHKIGRGIHKKIAAGIHGSLSIDTNLCNFYCQQKQKRTKKKTNHE